jgi:hypothetical protein
MVHLAERGGSYDRDAIRERVVRRFGYATFGRRLLDLYSSLLPSDLRARCAG